MHTSTKWLAAEVVFVLAVIAVLAVLHHPPLFSYEWHKLLHVFGAILLVGNIIITAVWMLMAERTGNPAVLRFAVVGVNWADVFFTVPGIFLLIANGDVLSEQWGGILHERWIAASLALFAVSGVIWIGFLIRYQNRLIRLSATLADEGSSRAFITLLHQWYLGGALATILPCVSLVLMFLKPALRM